MEANEKAQGIKMSNEEFEHNYTEIDKNRVKKFFHNVKVKPEGWQWQQQKNYINLS